MFSYYLIEHKTVFWGWVKFSCFDLRIEIAPKRRMTEGMEANENAHEDWIHW